MLMANTKTPMYEQLYIQLRTCIENGHYHCCEALPSERDLASQHGISRDTVRKAVHLLEQCGYVTREQGKGTIVKKSDAA